VSEYQAWIDTKYPTQASAYGKCYEATTAMVSAFPELRRVRGQVITVLWGERDHWWCVAPNGSVVDPTKRQFPAVLRYMPWDESKGEPPQRRKCPDCGDEHHGEDDFCDDSCRRRYHAYIMGGAL
jgi:hypothetical protein